MANEAFIMADIEIKKQTVYDKFKAIKREQHSLDVYGRQMYGGFRPRRSLNRITKFLRG
jgi:hypothetical protein